MKLKSKNLIFTLLGMALLTPASAFAGMAYDMNGYAPNSSSPVVGGFALYTVTGSTTRCTGGNCYSTPYTTNYYRPFGDLNLVYGSWEAGGTWVGNAACPNNTAKIQVSADGTGEGYLADNGVWYNTVYHYGWTPAQKVYVCVETDTAQGWYGGQ